MAYSFQTFSVGQVLTASQVNQIEVNIRDHVHGIGGVAEQFRGALFIICSNQNTQSGITTSLSFLAQSTVYDTTSNLFSIASNTLIVMKGASARVRLTAQAQFAIGSGGTVELLVSKNGVAYWAGGPSVQDTAVIGTGAKINMNSAVVSVNSGDYFSLNAYQSQNNSLAILGSASTPFTWLGVELIS